MIMVFGSMMLLSCDPKVVDENIPQNDNMITDSICEIRSINSSIHTWEDMVNIATQFDTDTLTNKQKDVLKIILDDMETYGLDNYEKYFKD